MILGTERKIILPGCQSKEKLHSFFPSQLAYILWVLIFVYV